MNLVMENIKFFRIGKRHLIPFILFQIIFSSILFNEFFYPLMDLLGLYELKAWLILFGIFFYILSIITIYSFTHKYNDHLVHEMEVLDNLDTNIKVSNETIYQGVLRDLKNTLTIINPDFWTLTLTITGFLIMPIFCYYLNRKLKIHEQAEELFVYIILRFSMGIHPYGIFYRKRIEDMNILYYLMLSILTLGAFNAYAWYELLNNYSNHINFHIKWENSIK